MRLGFCAYLVLLHGLVLVLVLKTNFLFLAGKTLGVTSPFDPLPFDQWRDERLLTVLRQAKDESALLPGRVVLLGDSIVAQLDAALVDGDAVNFGIPGDTTRSLYARLPAIMGSIQRSRAVVVEIGINDMRYRDIDQIAHDYAVVLDGLSLSPRILAVSVLPVDERGSGARRASLRNVRIAAMNRELKRVCEAHARCRFLDAWAALADHSVYSDDGVHLSAAGNQALGGLIRGALSVPN
jgi:lysophospholipase L1-like esterase